MSGNRERLCTEISLLLGAQMIDVELDPAHYDLSISIALEKFRQKTDVAYDESDISIRTSRDQQSYTLPDNVSEVISVTRRGFGQYTQGGVDFNPTAATYYNSLLPSPNSSGGLALWDFYNQYIETTDRVLGTQFTWKFVRANKQLVILSRVSADEDILVTTWTNKTEQQILGDHIYYPWIRSYATAQSKFILGEARSKFTSGIGGPNGIVTLNGDAIKQEAILEMDKLEAELNRRSLGGTGVGMIIG